MAALRWHWNRPSSWVVLWTGVVVGAFVATGDLRIDGAAPAAPVAAPAPVASAPARPSAREVVRRAVACCVLDALGQPIIGAEACLAGAEPARADGNGAVAVSLAAGDVVDVLFRAPGRVPTWLRVAEGSPDVHVVQLAPRAPWDGDAVPAAPDAVPTRLAEGVLRDAQGQPLAAAFVAAAGTTMWARTDAFGRFAVRLPAGDVVLVACADGDAAQPGAHAMSTAFAAPAGPGRMPAPDLHAVEAGAVRGIVRGASGAPAVGAFVAVEAGGVRRVVATGEGGAFRVGGLPAGPCRIAPFAWKGAVAAAQTVALGGRSIDLDVALAPVEPARVRVVDEAGAPVPGAYVAASVDGLRRGVVRADADGFAAVPWRADASFDVRHGAGHAQLPVRRFEPEPAQLVVGMP